MRLARAGVDEGGAGVVGVVVFLDRGMVSPWMGVAAVETVVASNKPHGKPAGAAGGQKKPARVRVNVASGYSRLYSRDESACFSRVFRV